MSHEISVADQRCSAIAPFASAATLSTSGRGTTINPENFREGIYLHRYISSTEAFQVNDLDDLTDAIDKYFPSW